MPHAPLYENPRFREYFRRHRFTVVDVGAAGGAQEAGLPPREMRLYVGFEPNPAEWEKLKASADPASERYLNVGLADRSGEADLFITRKAGSSSLLRPNLAFTDRFRPGDFDVVERERIVVDTLDAQLALAGVEEVDYVKLDTQGTELAIMKGGPRALAQAFGLLVEVEFHRLYEGQPLFGDVHVFLEGQGFELFDLVPRYWKQAVGGRYGQHKGQIIFADALYLRGPASFAGLLEALPAGEARTAKLLKAVHLCGMHGFLDYAALLASARPDDLGAPEREALRLFFEEHTPLSRRIPNFRGRRRLADKFLELHFMFRFPPK